VRSIRRQASGVLAVLPTFGLTDLSLFAAFALTYNTYAPRVKRASAFPSTSLRTGLGGLFLNIPSRFGVGASEDVYLPHGVNYSTVPSLQFTVLDLKNGTEIAVSPFTLSAAFFTSP